MEITIKGVFDPVAKAIRPVMTLQQPPDEFDAVEVAYILDLLAKGKDDEARTVITTHFEHYLNARRVDAASALDPIIGSLKSIQSWNQIAVG